ncbi:hypothetical protein QAD02_016641 [Eretmocerus hayati]|uniref:Uncharacterized protein n=1 Tax=Eretmocerus hayati TaxID=131215 RepID=A0ACC2PE53_9HYME|nr:hypothetical protein QAD02_016641 [Eretmocerus hayati]
MLFNYVVLILGLVRSNMIREQFIQFWVEIQTFDEFLQLLIECDELPPTTIRSKSPTYKLMIIQFQQRLWGIFGISVIGWTAVNVSGMYAFHETYLRNVSYMIPYVLTFTFALVFCGLAFSIDQRLDQLIDYASHGAVNKFKGPVDEINIEKIKTMLQQLVGACESLNEMYSWPLLFVLWNIFGHLTCNLYLIILRITQRIKEHNELGTVICHSCWSFMFFLQLGLIHFLCNSISKKEYNLSEQWISYKVQITAADCFDVNLKTLVSTIGHLVTYLVILLQIPDSRISSTDS